MHEDRHQQTEDHAAGQNNGDIKQRVRNRAAEDGIGIVQLAEFLVREQLATGSLEVLLPDWALPSGIVHAVFPSRRGLSPSVRSFIDFLAAEFRRTP